MLIRGAGAAVTGGASGLGRAVVEMLAQSGAHVTIIDRDEAGAAAVVASTKGCSFERADMADAASIAAAIEAAQGRSPLRILVNCAGIGAGARVLDRDLKPHDQWLWNRVLAVNLTGTFIAMSEAAQWMARNEPMGADGVRGVIINTASAAAYDGQSGQAAYAASKGAVVAMTLPSARDLARHNIRVCAIAPGTFNTPMFSKLDDSHRQALEHEVPYPSRLGRPDEFASLVTSIIENDYLNGEVVRLDGGLRMR